MTGPLVCNAFRLLSLPADVEARQVYRQQQRIQNALVIGDSPPRGTLPFLNPIPLEAEGLLDAVHRIETERFIEELFWVHDLDGTFNLKSDDQADVIASLLAAESQKPAQALADIDSRIAEATEAASQIMYAGERSSLVFTLDDLRKQRDERRKAAGESQAVAQHNLAVIWTYLALQSKGPQSLQNWCEALKYWNKALHNKQFWDFVEHRAKHLGRIDQAGHPSNLRERAMQVVRAAVVEKTWEAVDASDHGTVAGFVQLIQKHETWLGASAQLSDLASQLIKEGSGGIGAVIDRMASLQKDADPQLNRRLLVASEADVRRLGEQLGGTLKLLEPLVSSAAWNDAYATAYERLSIAYFNILGDENEALRLIIQACALAKEVRLKDRLLADWRRVQRSILCSEALELDKAGNYAGADQKFAGAESISTDEERAEIAELRQALRRARVFHNVDTSKRSPSLATINGLGATFYGKRDFDANTNTYVTNHWFVFFFLPVIPIASYRVSNAGSGSYQIYGQVPLTPFLRKYRWGLVPAILLFFIVINLFDNGAPVTPSGRGSTGGASGTGAAGMSFNTSSVSAQSSDGSAIESERSSIEAERAQLNQESDSLDFRKSQLDAEASELKRIEEDVRSVDSTYAAGTMPDDVRRSYNATVDEYNRRAPEYNRSIRQYKANLKEHQQQVVSFNLRVARYNSSR
jgi:hypothetical protein